MARKRTDEDTQDYAGADASNVPHDELKVRKSIVPAKYANKYTKGGSDELANFINDQCTGEEGFEFTAFFQLCRKNGIPETQVQKYENLVVDKLHGANGRARMTLRNMLGTIARKTGHLTTLKNESVPVLVPPPARPERAAA